MNTIATLQAENDKLRADLKAAEDLASTAGTQVTTITAERDKAIKDLADAGAELVTVKADLAKRDADITAKDGEIAKLKADVVSVETKAAQLLAAQGHEPLSITPGQDDHEGQNVHGKKTITLEKFNALTPHEKMTFSTAGGRIEG